MWKKWIITCLSLLLLVGCIAPTSNESGERLASTLPNATPTVSTLDVHGTYDSKEEVALYLHTYHQLPSNFMTKDEARKKGWDGGALSATIPGMSIGGDPFGNFEGSLPEEYEPYFECDIDTLGKTKRGAKRIVYSQTGWIYYTAYHYESFEVLYEGES